MTAEHVLIFNSLHRVLRAEELLEAGDARFEVIQVPRRLTSDCGLAVAVPASGLPRVVEVLLAAGHLPEVAYRRDGGGWLELDLFSADPGDDQP